MKQSPLFQLNINDFLKGLLMAVLTPVIFTIQQTIQNGSLVFNWKAIGMTAVGGFVAYIIKNFFTPAAPTKEVTQTASGKVTKTVVQTDSVDVTVKP